MISPEFEEKLRVLVEQAWERDVTLPEIEAWLNNFSGLVASRDEEQRLALVMLSKFMYFGQGLTREMLRSVYREHFEGPLLQRIRRNMANTKDSTAVRAVYESELRATRFIGVGNPAESGAHLLYYFRQVNHLPKELFTDLASAFVPVIDLGDGATKYRQRDMSVSRYVFFDDLVGSGTQVSKYLRSHISVIRQDNPDLDLRFVSLFSTTEGLNILSAPDFFGEKASTLYELDDTYKAFGLSSRYFSAVPSWFSLDTLKQMCEVYGRCLWRSWPLGYRNGQMLLGFSHNTPDNTLPIFWADGVVPPWSPMFMRYHKQDL